MQKEIVNDRECFAVQLPYSNWKAYMPTRLRGKEVRKLSTSTNTDVIEILCTLVYKLVDSEGNDVTVNPETLEEMDFEDLTAMSQLIEFIVNPQTGEIKKNSKSSDKSE